MESCRILQDTYEKLYVLTRYLAKFMDDEIQKIAGWKEYCDDILGVSDSWKKWKGRNWTNFYELDLYYLLFILKRAWNYFRQHTGSLFFSEENKKLFVGTEEKSEYENVNDENYSLFDIRNTVAHPENMGFLEGYYSGSHDEKYIKYKKWDEIIERASLELGFSMGTLLCEIHEKEKNELMKVIFENSTYKTMSSPKYPSLSEKTRMGIERTKDRIEKQSTAAGIMAFFKDSEFLQKGNYIKEELEANNLPTFEDIREKIWRHYYGFTK